MKNFLLALTLFIPLLFSSCSKKDEMKPLKISATTWVGYTPLFYAKEKGWLKKINVKLLHVVSLSENMYLYKAGNSDAYAGTQYEYSILKKNLKALFPIFYFDRSNGGDIIMSNTSIANLQKENGAIDVYLEMDSINYPLFKDFVEAYSLKQKKFNYINRDQAQIAALQKKDMKRSTVIVTYAPYDFTLEDQGFIEIASTKDNLDLLVFDAMFTTKKKYEEHKKQFLKIKEYIDSAVEVLKRDPQGYHETIKPYLEGVSYQDFLHSVNDIEWINTKLSSELQTKIDKVLERDSK